MGVSQIVVPLDAEMLGYARDQGVPVDGIDGTGCRPRLDQLVEIVESIPGHSSKTSRQGEDFQINIDSEKLVTWWNPARSRLVEVPAFSTLINGSVDSSGVLTLLDFHGSAELLIAVVRQLTNTCGPQMFFNDCDAIPWLILSPNAMPLGAEPWTLELADLA